jgi:uroporphyrinogen-III decarboxylase
VAFDPPDLEQRYLKNKSKPDFEEWLRTRRRNHAVFVKTGGPFLRTTFVRGETRFLMDIAEDPALAKAFADKVGDHITAVGVEALSRSGLHGTGVIIYDDMAYIHGPLFSPVAFERVLLPAYHRMVRAYRQAGARHVLLHSDGDIRPILDMLVEAGIEGINPIERRAGMLMADLRRRYPRLILTGGMCNTETLVRGPVSRIEAEAREIIDLGRDGGVVIGSHSISPEVPLEHYVAYRRVCTTYGVFDGGRTSGADVAHAQGV